MDWNWQVIIDSIPQLLSGVVLTLELVVIACVAGLILGLFLALGKLSKNWLIKAFPVTFIFFFRGTPLLVQMFLIYYGLSQFDVIKDSIFWGVLKQPFWCAIIAFTLNTAAYVAEIIRGAIEAIPAGELEAAEAIGMSPIQKLTRITLPRAFGIMLPAYSNEVIFMLKSSALAMTIALMDITGIAKTISARTYTIFELYFAAGMIYLLLSWVILFGFRILEKRFNKHMDYVPPETVAGTVGKI